MKAIGVPPSADLAPAIPRRLLPVRTALAVLVAAGLYGVAGVTFVAGQVGLPGDPRAHAVVVSVAAALLLGLSVGVAFLVLYFGRLARELGEALRAREAEIAAARLEQFQGERMRLLGGIAAGLAHEIGNPVAAVAGIAEAIAGDPQAGPVARAEAAELIAQAQRLGGITRRLAVIAGLRSRERGPVAVNALVEAVTSLVSLDERFRHIELVPWLDRGVPALLAAEDELVQLLLHLLSNAAESFEGCPRAPARIRLETAMREGALVIAVEDNGRGMDEATRARAMEPLFTTKPAGQGNGLGLDACRRIVEGLGGRIEIASTPGWGTRVTSTFPVSRPSLDAL